MKYALGERVWLWRKRGPERWTLVSGVVRRRHRDETVTVSFQTRNGKWTMRRGQGYPATDGARISTQGVYREEEEAQKTFPVDYEAIDV